MRVAPFTDEETSRGKTALEQSTAKKRDGWREKMNDLTNTLHVEDEKNIDDAQLGKSDKSEKETLRYDIAKVERRLKFSTGKKPDSASTLKRKNRGDVDKTDDFAYREDNEDDDLLFLSSQNESDEREKKRAATATKVLGFKNNATKTSAWRKKTTKTIIFPPFPPRKTNSTRLKTPRKLSDVLRRAKPNLKCKNSPKISRWTLKKSIEQTHVTSLENVQTAKRSIDDTAHQLEKEEQKILARLDDITKKFSRDFEREREFLLAVKSKANPRTKTPT